MECDKTLGMVHRFGQRHDVLAGVPEAPAVRPSCASGVLTMRYLPHQRCTSFKERATRSPQQVAHPPPIATPPSGALLRDGSVTEPSPSGPSPSPTVDSVLHSIWVDIIDKEELRFGRRLGASPGLPLCFPLRITSVTGGGGSAGPGGGGSAGTNRQASKPLATAPTLRPARVACRLCCGFHKQLHRCCDNIVFALHSVACRRRRTGRGVRGVVARQTGGGQKVRAGGGRGARGADAPVRWAAHQHRGAQGAVPGRRRALPGHGVSDSSSVWRTLVLR